MGNKLRDMFDDSKQEYTQKVSFESPENYNNFLEAIKKATEEGIPSEVKGVSGISVSVKDGDNQFPLQQYDSVTKVMIFLCEKKVEQSVETDCGERILKFRRKELKDKFELQNVDGKGADYKIVYDVKDKSINVTYKAIYEQANDLDELIDYYNTLFYFSKKIFRTDVKDEDVDNVLNHFISSILYFKRLKEIGKRLNIVILPKDIERIDDEDLFIEKVYFSLIENKLIRSNRKVTSMNNIHFPTDKRSREEPMMVTYLEKGRLLLLKNEIDVYIVNMALNLIIDKEEPEDKGGAKLFFKDDENCPMYIVSRIFLDEKQAELELEHALNNKDSYINANTLIEYIKESHESYLAEK